MVKTTRTKDSKTSASDVALANYLDAMLHTATESVNARWPEQDTHGTETDETGAVTVTPSPPEPAPTAPETASVSPVMVPGVSNEEQVVRSQTQQKIEHIAQTLREPEIHNDESVSDQLLPDTEAATSAETDKADLSRWLDNGRPVWAQQRFDCLVFVVDGLKLAVPLILLGNIHTLDKDLTPLFDQPDWFLGLLPVASGRNLRVVDTARLVMPERYRAESVGELGFAVGVYGSDWAFGCHQIEGSISLEPDRVKWRSSRTSRPWLAGTIIDRMCALVDLHEFSRTVFKGG